jgi:hypothetical protein
MQLTATGLSRSCSTLGDVGRSSIAPRTTSFAAPCAPRARRRCAPRAGQVAARRHHHASRCRVEDLDPRPVQRGELRVVARAVDPPLADSAARSGPAGCRGSPSVRPSARSAPIIAVCIACTLSRSSSRARARPSGRHGTPSSSGSTDSSPLNPVRSARRRRTRRRDRDRLRPLPRRADSCGAAGAAAIRRPRRRSRLLDPDQLDCALTTVARRWCCWPLLVVSRRGLVRSRRTCAPRAEGVVACSDASASRRSTRCRAGVPGSATRRCSHHGRATGHELRPCGLGARAVPVVLDAHHVGDTAAVVEVAVDRVREVAPSAKPRSWT